MAKTPKTRLKEIEITIDEDGSSSVEAFGYTDNTCKAATREIEEALGAVTSRKEKDHGVVTEKAKVKAK